MLHSRCKHFAGLSIVTFGWDARAAVLTRESGSSYEERRAAGGYIVRASDSGWVKAADTRAGPRTKAPSARRPRNPVSTSVARATSHASTGKFISRRNWA